jgi:two-component system sensor histidine kinase DctS
MPHSLPPQPFQPGPVESVGKKLLWLTPGLLAVAFAVLMAAWAQVNDVQAEMAEEQTLLADMASVEAQLTGRRDMEMVRLRETAARLVVAAKDVNQGFAAMPEVVAGLDRLWNRLVWLDEDNRVIARAERKAPIASSVREDLRIQATGQADHLSVFVRDVNAQGNGKLLARFEITDLLKSTDLGWLNRRYEVEFISELGEVIATTANPSRPPQGASRERPLVGFKDTSLRLTPYDASLSWTQNPKTLALLAALLLLGGVASQMTRHEMQLVSRAVTEAKTEAAWRQSMEDSALVGLRARDAEGRVLYVNKTLCDMVGYSRDELVGLKPPLPFWPPDAVDAMMARNLNTLAGGAPTTGFETRWRHKDGHSIDVMIFEARLVNSNGHHIGWMGSIIDISERRRLEERDRTHTDVLAQHARLNDLGLLASELAHELNQPLTTILTYSAGLKISLQSLHGIDPEDLAAMDAVNQHARKAGDIVNWIRRQTSRTETVRKICDLDAIVSEVVGLRMRQIQRIHATLEQNLSAADSKVLVDRIGIEQVIANLIRNAMDAVSIQDGIRTICVSTQEYVDQKSGTAFVQVTVVDSGSGLQGRTLETLCTTFYSTKSHGMGLGLGICRSIIEAHGGSLTAVDMPGGGAQFSFTIPAISL